MSDVGHVVTVTARDRAFGGSRHIEQDRDREIALRGPGLAPETHKRFHAVLGRPAFARDDFAFELRRGEVELHRNEALPGRGFEGLENVLVTAL